MIKSEHQKRVSRLAMNMYVIRISRKSSVSDTAGNPSTSLKQEASPR